MDVFFSFFQLPRRDFSEVLKLSRRNSLVALRVQVADKQRKTLAGPKNEKCLHLRRRHRARERPAPKPTKSRRNADDCRRHLDRFRLVLLPLKTSQLARGV